MECPKSVRATKPRRFAYCQTALGREADTLIRTGDPFITRSLRRLRAVASAGGFGTLQRVRPSLATSHTGAVLGHPLPHPYHLGGSSGSRIESNDSPRYAQRGGVVHSSNHAARGPLDRRLRLIG